MINRYKAYYYRSETRRKSNKNPVTAQTETRSAQYDTVSMQSQLAYCFWIEDPLNCY